MIIMKIMKINKIKIRFTKIMKMLYNACDILNNFAWRASAFQLTWKKSQAFTAEVRSGWKRKTGNVDWRNFIENVCLASIYKFSDVTKFGLEVNFSSFRSMPVYGLYS